MGLVPLFVAGALVVACSDDEADTGEATEATTEASATEGTTTETAGEAMAETVTVTAVDYGFEGLPESAKVGTVLALTNTSTAELHELVAVRLPDDESRSVEELLALPEEELMALVGPEPAMVIVAPPGEAGFPVVGDGVLSQPGRYAIVCFIPTGADPQEYLEAAQAATEGPPQVEGGPPHFVQGMFGELTVTE